MIDIRRLIFWFESFWKRERNNFVESDWFSFVLYLQLKIFAIHRLILVGKFLKERDWFFYFYFFSFLLYYICSWKYLKIFLLIPLDFRILRFWYSPFNFGWKVFERKNIFGKLWRKLLDRLFLLSLFFSVIFAIEFSRCFFQYFSRILEYINFSRKILNNNLSNLSFRALNYSNLFL